MLSVALTLFLCASFVLCAVVPGDDVFVICGGNPPTNKVRGVVLSGAGGERIVSLQDLPGNADENAAGMVRCGFLSH